MKIVNLVQGTPEWHAHRAQYHNASDAPAMMGCSPYKTRNQLVREKASGVAEEVTPERQRIFDNGHRYEALARPLAEDVLGQELYPCVGVQAKYSASFDGLTLMEEIAFEHKSLNDDLRLAMPVDGSDACLPMHYQVQMEHQLMVSGAERCLFMASKWNGEELIEERHCWYSPNAELRARIVAGWAQFEADVEAYEPEAPVAPAPTGRAPDHMPALRIEVTGMVTASNLAEWKGQAIAVFQNISTDLTTDQDFADAEKTVKWCSDIEDQLKAAKQHALSQTESIELLFRTIDEITAEAKAKRLDLDRLVTRRKEERRTEIGNAARRAVQDHVRAINETLGEHGLPMPATLVADISAAMKGKRSFSSMQEAVDAVAANAKIASSQAADRVRANAAILAEHPAHSTLFADRVSLCASKTAEDLRNLVAMRIGAFEKQEEERLAAEREKIRKEEEAKAQKRADDEAADRRAKEEEAQVAQAAAQAPAPVVAEPVAEPATSPAAPAPQQSYVRAVAAPEPAEDRAPWAPEGQRIKLGEINALIGPLTISAEGLRQLGFEPVSTERGAKLYAADQVPAMCEQMIRVLRGAANGQGYPLAA